MGYAKQRLKPANGNSHSSVSKPETKKSHRSLWAGGLLLSVIGAAALGLVYMRNSKNGQPTETSFVVGTEIVSGIEWKYRVSHGKAEIGNGSSAAITKSATGTITIPPMLGGYPVARIGESAFALCSELDGVTMPDSVTNIGSYAFSGCERLRSVSIPDSVTSIGDRVFEGCIELKSISVAAGNKNYKSVNGLLLSKDGKTLIAGVNGEVTIPDSVTSIGVRAFFGLGALHSVTIPASVTRVGDGALSYCSELKSISVAAGNKNYKSANGLLLSKDGKTLIAGVNGEVTIPDSVTSIGECAFVDCSRMVSVTMPDSVTSIGDCAFGGCERLRSVSMPDSVTNIGSYAFSRCEWLSSVSIPNSVTSIGEGAFSRCERLGSVTIPDSVTSIGNRVFEGCIELKSISVAAGNKNYKSVNGLLLSKDGKTLIEGVNVEATIPDSVTIIGDSAYFDRGALHSMTIPDGVTHIGDSAFSRCRNLRSVTIPDSVTSIGECAFVDCSSLTGVTIPDSVTRVGDCALSYCSELKSISVAAGNKNYKSANGLLLSKDGKTLIAGVNGEVTIPDSVTSIGECAFFGCSRMASVTIPDGVTRIGTRAFSYCCALQSVTIPYGVTSVGECAFSGSLSLQSVTIPNSVTSIGECAFSGCCELTSITIPDSVTSIGNEAFSSCDSLTSVRLPRRFEGTIDKSVFDGCSDDMVITYYDRCSQ